MVTVSQAEAWVRTGQPKTQELGGGEGDLAGDGAAGPEIQIWAEAWVVWAATGRDTDLGGEARVRVGLGGAPSETGRRAADLKTAGSWVRQTSC